MKSFLAHRHSGASGEQVVAAQHIRPMVQRSEVLRVNASLVLAEMINVQTIRDRSDVEHVGCPVSLPEPPIHKELPVAGISVCAGPLPTRFRAPVFLDEPGQRRSASHGSYFNLTSLVLQ